MFYCHECATKYQWPETLASSYGKCEMCGQIDICNDTPSSQLPITPLKRKRKKKK